MARGRARGLASAGGIGLVKKINVRRAGRLAADLADIAAAAQRDADGNLRFPIKAVHAMFLRVDREGGAIRLAGSRVGDWIVVRMIVIFPRCDDGSCP